MTGTNKRNSKRFFVVLIGSIALWTIMIGKLYLIQVVHGADYRKVGRRQVENREPLPAVRGNVYDRNFKQLTMNVEQYSFGVHPTQVKDKYRIATVFAQTFGSSRSHYLNRMRSSEPFVWLERNVEKSKAQPVLRLEKDGLIIKTDSERYYPFHEIASQLLGCTNVDGLGAYGIEAQYDSLLKGHPGWTTLRKSGRGGSMPSPQFPTIPPVNGDDIQLTINFDYQTILEEALKRGMNRYEAKKGMGVLLDPSTGDILGMTSLPSFDPNDPSRASMETMKNRAITDVFEPGSTFKIVAATAALATNTVQPSDQFYCENGSIRIEDQIIHDWKPYNWLTFENVLVNSSNIGIIKVARKAGQEALYKYLRRFGFGTETGSDLLAESSGIVHNLDTWTEISPASVAIGHEVSVTALQMANAFAAIANDGYLMEPHVIKQITDQHGDVVYKSSPKVIRQVASEKVMHTLKNMLEQVVERGTGTLAKIEGMRIAGKTGTAQKSINGHYSETKYISSFIGFLPVDNPRLLCAIILDEPKFGKHWGGHAAAPIAHEVFTQIINSTDTYFATAAHAETGNHVTRKASSYSAKQSAKQPVSLNTRMVLTDQSNKPNDTANPITRKRMPDLRGKSLRKAITELYDLGMEVNIDGSGTVVTQWPPPGIHVKTGTTCKLELSR